MEYVSNSFYLSQYFINDESKINFRLASLCSISLLEVDELKNMHTDLMPQGANPATRPVERSTRIFFVTNPINICDTKN